MIEHVETLLRTQDQSPTNNSPTDIGAGSLPTNGRGSQRPDMAIGGTNLAMGGADWDMDRSGFAAESPQQQAPMDDFQFNPNLGMDMNGVGGGQFTWEMIGLGLEEPLPTQETIDKLHQIYFEKIHPSIPMIHKYRYLAAMNLYASPFSPAPPVA